MVLKLLFYDKSKNNVAWWNRLWDRFNKIQNRQWTVVIVGGAHYKDASVEFKFTYLDGKLVADQKSVNEIVWIFVLEQLNTEKFIVNGIDYTNQLKNR